MYYMRKEPKSCVSIHVYNTLFTGYDVLAKHMLPCILRGATFQYHQLVKFFRFTDGNHRPYPTHWYTYTHTILRENYCNSSRHSLINWSTVTGVIHTCTLYPRIQLKLPPSIVEFLSNKITTKNSLLQTYVVYQ